MKGSTAVGELFGGSAGKSNTPAPKEGSETLTSYRNALQQPQSGKGQRVQI